MKKLLSSLGIVVMFCAVAMAQEGPVVVEHADPGRPFIERGEAETMPLSPPHDVLYFRARGRRGGLMCGPMHGPMGKWWKNPELAQKVGLSDEQVQKLDKISYESQLQMIDLRATLEKEQLMLGQQMQADHPNNDAVLEQVDKVSQAKAAIARARVQTMLATRNVLTTEQWKKLKTARMDFHHRFFMHRGFGGQIEGRGMPKTGGTPPKP